MFGFDLKLVLIAAAVIAAIGAAGIITHNLKKQGYDNAISDVQKQTDKAGNAAIEGARSVDECLDSGGVWERSTGRCRRP